MGPESDARVGRVRDHDPMQLAPVATTSPVLLPTGVASVAPAATAAPAARPTWTAPRVAAPSAPLAVEGAADGVARLAAPTAPAFPPIVDFPGIAAGQVFDIVKGSKAGPIGVKGEALVNRLDPDHATFHVEAGRFGIHINVDVDIQQIAADQVRITSHGSGIPDTVAIGKVIEARTNHAVFEQVDDPSKRTTIDHDGNGTITIDATIPTFGNAHLVLQRR
ncbi:MAG: hypothetical protein JWM98_3381 [Thermoleophilia bacterium]|nr:hypothetical protein [Thermoleophilia bacterium]